MFNFCAVHYLHQWLTLDRSYVQAARADTLTLLELSDYLYRYQARRSIPGKGDDKLKTFWNEIIAIKTQDHNVADSIQHCFRLLSDKYHRRFLSAISKAACIKHGHPVAIYDSRTRIALRKFGYSFRDNEYGEYHRAWMKYFYRDEVQNELNNACAFVPTSCFAQRLIAHGAANNEEISEWSQSDWFRNRVIDIRLFFMSKDDLVKQADLARMLGCSETM